MRSAGSARSVLGWVRRRRTERDVDQVRPLVALTHRFLAGELDATTYDERFRRAMFAADGLTDPVWEVLDAHWHTCEAYVDDAALRDPGDLDPDGLRAAARRMLARLAALSPALATPPPRRPFEILHDLLEQHHFAADLVDELRALPWDGPEQVVLHPRHVLHALALRDAGTTSDQELLAWAEAVEVREDVGRDAATADLVTDAVHELANPDLFPTLSPDLLARLRVAENEG